MSALLVLLVLAAPGTIRVRVEGDATTVTAYRDGRAVRTAKVRDGRARLDGLDGDRYTLRAEGAGVASDFVADVRPVADRAEGDDAVLRARPAFPLRVRTAPGAWLWVDGVRLPLRGALLPAGFHRVVVDHDKLVSSAERLVRVDGPLTLSVPLERGLVVTGAVVDPDGKPVAGAEIRVFADGFDTRRQGATGADGRFGVAGVRGHVVSVDPSDQRTGSMKRRSLTPGRSRAMSRAGSSFCSRRQGAWSVASMSMRPSARPAHMASTSAAERRGGWPT